MAQFVLRVTLCRRRDASGLLFVEREYKLLEPARKVLRPIDRLRQGLVFCCFSASSMGLRNSATSGTLGCPKDSQEGDNSRRALRDGEAGRASETAVVQEGQKITTR